MFSYRDAEIAIKKSQKSIEIDDDAITYITNFLPTVANLYTTEEYTNKVVATVYFLMLKRIKQLENLRNNIDKVSSN